MKKLINTAARLSLIALVAFFCSDCKRQTLSRKSKNIISVGQTKMLPHRVVKRRYRLSNQLIRLLPGERLIPRVLLESATNCLCG